jgi:Ca2+/Na+ antiporter
MKYVGWGLLAMFFLLFMVIFIFHLFHGRREWDDTEENLNWDWDEQKKLRWRLFRLQDSIDTSFILVICILMMGIGLYVIKNFP